MYSGTTFRVKSGRVLGVHQKIDKVARRQLEHHIPDNFYFPSIAEILHFEGLNGPDGIKRKSPGKDEPWHYIDPSDPNDNTLWQMIVDHTANLTAALKSSNKERAAFEAAWLAHAITDGLTPAHHYPLEEKLTELRGGEGLETRNTKKEKVIIPGASKREMLRNNWEFWGAKGVMTTHLTFELGIATTIASRKFDDTLPDGETMLRLQQDGFKAIFFQAVKDVAALRMYEEFTENGWTRRLARQTNQFLIPIITQTVCLGWQQAIEKAVQKKS